MLRLIFVLTLLVTYLAPLRSEEPVRRTADIIYARKAGLALTMDVFQPPNPNGAGVILVVSAGFASSKDAINPAFTTELTQRGYTCFAVLHGSQPHFTISEMIPDVYQAVRFIRSRAKDFGIDPQRLGAVGGSSGGLLALHLGTSAPPAQPEAVNPLERYSGQVAAVAAFFPPTDYLNYGKIGHELLGTAPHPVPYRAPYDFREFDKASGLFERVSDPGKQRTIMRAISPISHVHSKCAPTLLIHGDKDELVPIQQSERMRDALQAHKVPVKLLVRPGAGHGWLTILADMKPVADWMDQLLTKK